MLPSPSYRHWAKLLTAMLLLSALPSAFAASDEAEKDPWENVNRKVFRFNEVLDKWITRPVAIGYKAVMPDPLEKGVANIFDNILEIPSTLNSALQGNLRSAGYDSGRFLVNSTIGLGGLLDVAQYMKLPAKEHEDFGQTLAVWGVKSGPYLVLPFFGPSSLRDGLAKPVDWYSEPSPYIDHVPTYNTVLALKFTNTRAQLLSLEGNLVGDKYTLFRDIYFQRREFLINNGNVADDFGAGDFGDDEFGDETF